MSISNKSRKLTAKEYTPEFRMQAVKLVLSQDQSLSQTARDLVIPMATLHTWVSKTRQGEWSAESENLTAVKLEQDTKAINSKPANISQNFMINLDKSRKKTQS